MPSHEVLPRGRHGLSRTEIIDSQRRRLLRAVVDEVAETGFAGTTAARVSARASVSSRNFYELFGNLRECFLTAYDERVRAFLDDLALELNRPPGREARLARFDRLLTSYLAKLCADPAFAKAALVDIYAAGPEALLKREQTQHRFITLTYEILWGGRASRITAYDLDDAEMLVAAITYLVTGRVATDRFDDLRGLREPVMRLARRVSR